MSLQERLRTELTEDAERRPVDVALLYARTQDRIGRPPPRSPAGVARSQWLRPILAATAVGAVVIAGVGLSGVDLPGGTDRRAGLDFDGDQPSEVTRARNGNVEDTFRCPSTVPYDFGGGSGPLRAAAKAGPRAFADRMGATRFELIGGPEATVLRLGNADGSLASLNTMHKIPGPDGWILDDMTACSGDGSALLPARRAGSLGTHGTDPWPAEQVVGSSSSAVLVDDRAYYDTAGLVRHRSIYAHMCEVRICLELSDGFNPTLGATVAAGGAPGDLTDFFLPEQLLVNRPPPPAYALYAVYDRGNDLARVSWSPRGGRARAVDATSGPGWTGRLFLVLAPYDDLAAITVHPRDGTPTTYRVPSPVR